MGTVTVTVNDCVQCLVLVERKTVVRL